MSWETFFWGDDQGYQLRRFTNTRVSYHNIQLYRYIAIGILTFSLILGFFYDKPFAQFIYMTTWGSYFSFVSLIFNVVATDDQYKHPGRVDGIIFWRWRTAVWFHEMALSFDVMITIMYWGFVRSSQLDNDVYYYYDIFIHILPLVFNLIDFILVRWKFRLQHFVTLVIVGVLYGIFNFTYVKITGEVIYSILSWDPVWQSMLLIVGLAALCSMTFWIFYRITIIYNLPSNQNYLFYPGGVEPHNYFLQGLDVEFGNTKPMKSVQSTFTPFVAKPNWSKTPVICYVPKDY